VPHGHMFHQAQDGEASSLTALGISAAGSHPETLRVSGPQLSNARSTRQLRARTKALWMTTEKGLRICSLIAEWKGSLATLGM
jgi:hypothetical protein